MPKYHVNVEGLNAKQYEIYAETKKDAERIAEKENPCNALRWTRVRTEVEKKTDDGLLMIGGAVVLTALAVKGAWYVTKFLTLGAIALPGAIREGIAERNRRHFKSLNDYNALSPSLAVKGACYVTKFLTLGAIALPIALPGAIREGIAEKNRRHSKSLNDYNALSPSEKEKIHRRDKIHCIFLFVLLGSLVGCFFLMVNYLESSKNNAKIIYTYPNALTQNDTAENKTQEVEPSEEVKPIVPDDPAYKRAVEKSEKRKQKLMAESEERKELSRKRLQAFQDERNCISSYNKWKYANGR